MGDQPELDELREKLERETAAYAERLDALDALAEFELPVERLPGQPELMQKLNELWRPAPRPEAGGLGGAFRVRAWDAVAGDRERSEAFQSTLVQVLNGHLEEAARLDAHLRQVVGALVQYFQRVQPLLDVSDRHATGIAVAHSELILETFDRRLEQFDSRLRGLEALRERLDAMTEQVAALRTALRSEPPPPEQASEALRADADATYVAFENRFRGEPSELMERLSDYVGLFESQAPVVDLGCGSGAFLELLKAAGIEARGIDSNERAVQACREKGLDVERGDIVSHLEKCESGSLGGVFAAQVVEHLLPPALDRLLKASHRALRAGGHLVLETVNVSSVTAFVESYVRDITHERPLHPETLRFLVAAAGFSDARVELRQEDSRLRSPARGPRGQPAAEGRASAQREHPAPQRVAVRSARLRRRRAALRLAFVSPLPPAETGIVDYAGRRAGLAVGGPRDRLLQ